MPSPDRRPLRQHHLPEVELTTFVAAMDERVPAGTLSLASCSRDAFATFPIRMPPPMFLMRSMVLAVLRQSNIYSNCQRREMILPLQEDGGDWDGRDENGQHPTPTSKNKKGSPSEFRCVMRILPNQGEIVARIKQLSIRAILLLLAARRCLRSLLNFRKIDNQSRATSRVFLLFCHEAARVGRVFSS